MEPIDFVMLWVDGADPAWQAERAAYRPDRSNNGSDENRYRDWDLLRYWFRGVERFAPWVHRVYFVTWGHCPAWLNRAHPKLTVVRHSDYIPPECLPTFNSNVIELYLHRIPELSEQFVLFNDDMFLTAPVRPEDFFKNGLPCESALLDAPAPTDVRDVFPHMMLNNAAVINQHFDKREVLRKNAVKFFFPGYGSGFVRNLLLAPLRYFSSFRGPHLATSHLKSTFETVWQAEPELLRRTGTHRFRSREDLTHWLMKDWQLCTGNFAPRRCRWGRHFELDADSGQAICRSIERQTYRMVCLNDSTAQLEMDALQKELAQSFERILPEPSGYER